jgi:hypothetical protein
VSGIQAHAGLSNGCRAGHSRSELLLDLGGKGVYSSYTLIHYLQEQEGIHLEVKARKVA